VSRDLECHVDANIAGGYSDEDEHSPESVLSQTGYVISYAICPIHWCSKVETELVLSTTEPEYIAALSTFLNLLSETKAFFPILNCEPNFLPSLGRQLKLQQDFQKSNICAIKKTYYSEVPSLLACCFR
jgi:hypothetical protein